MKPKTLLTMIMAGAISVSSAFNLGMAHQKKSSRVILQGTNFDSSFDTSVPAMSRKVALTGLISPVLLSVLQPSPANAKDGPILQSCVSECIYDCTKPKGDGQRTRAECQAECKEKCAKTRDKVVKGVPSAKSQKKLFPAKP